MLVACSLPQDSQGNPSDQNPLRLSKKHSMVLDRNIPSDPSMLRTNTKHLFLCDDHTAFLENVLRDSRRFRGPKIHPELQ